MRPNCFFLLREQHLPQSPRPSSKPDLSAFTSMPEERAGGLRRRGEERRFLHRVFLHKDRSGAWRMSAKTPRSAPVSETSIDLQDNLMTLKGAHCLTRGAKRNTVLAHAKNLRYIRRVCRFLHPLAYRHHFSTLRLTLHPYPALP